VVFGGVWFWKYKGYSGISQSLSRSGYPQQDLPSDLSDKRGQGGWTAPPKTQETPVSKAPAMGTSPADVLPEPSEKPNAPAEGAGKQTFSVEASQRTWIQVTMDDKSTQNAMLQPGDKRDWEAEKGMKIIIGNAGGVQMKWNGRPVEVPGRPGGVIRFSLPDQRYLKE
jgi:cytoskeleton protein RodZ